MQLVQVKNGKFYIHGVGETVSELIKFYYGHRQQHGYMEVIDGNGNILATFGSK